jgi:hypothetical protein
VTFSLYQQQRTGAPYLARFSRDVGYHGACPATVSLSVDLSWKCSSTGGNRTGAPRSPKRTWAENDGRSPSMAFDQSINEVFVPL